MTGGDPSLVVKEMPLNFRSRFWRIGYAILVGGGALLSQYIRWHHDDYVPPPPPAMTTQQAYDEICGPDNSCAKMAQARRNLEAIAARLKQSDAAPPPDEPPPAN